VYIPLLVARPPRLTAVCSLAHPIAAVSGAPSFLLNFLGKASVARVG